MMQEKQAYLSYLVTIILGILIGSICAFFLYSLHWIWELRLDFKYLIFSLPLMGFTTVFLYQKYGQESSLGIKLFLDDSKSAPILMTPLILFTTLFAHLGGASVGREGTAVQFGGAIGDFISEKFSKYFADKHLWRAAGMAAGFGALFGTPLAGICFAWELLKLGKLSINNLLHLLIASYTAHLFCSEVLHAPHTHYEVLSSFEWESIFKYFALAIACGLLANVYLRLHHKLKLLTVKYLKNEYFRIVIGSVIIILIYVLIDILLAENSYNKIAGLSVPSLENAFLHQPQHWIWFGKLLLTAFALSIGFKGGEVTPLFVIGGVFASSISVYLGLPLDISAAIGMIFMFLGTSKLPIACSIMALEVFGLQVFIVVAMFAYVVYFVSGKKGIYR
ncbi:MAG: hypothetical protein RLZZ175_753 [Bacteroidota bacterium]|jgi:H+/Cl- antiporter ClcA